MTETLFTTTAELEALERAADKARKADSIVRVPAAALRHLTMDHHKLFGMVKGRVQEPRP